MAFRWVDPNGKAAPAAEATQEAARRSATAAQRRRSGVRQPARLDDDLQAQLWRSLERAGWRIEEVDL